MNITRLLALVLLVLPALSSADDLPDWESMSIEELNKLDSEVANKLPFLPIMRRAFSETDSGLNPKAADLMMIAGLRDLYYTPYVLDTAKLGPAVKAFQRDLGEPQTGILTIGQANKLNQRMIRRNDAPVYASGSAKVFSYQDSYVSAEGTWIIEGEKIFDPINTSKITCNRGSASCEAIQASVLIPRIDSDDTSYNLTLNTTSYEVISWTDTEVVAKPYALSDCRSVLLTISIASNEVYEIIRNNNLEDCKRTVGNIPKLEKPRISRLVDGWTATYGWWQERNKQKNKLLNAEVQGLFDSATTSTE